MSSITIKIDEESCCTKISNIKTGQYFIGSIGNGAPKQVYIKGVDVVVGLKDGFTFSNNYTVFQYKECNADINVKSIR